MPDLLDTLAQRVDAAVGLIRKLRDRVAALEQELEVVNAAPKALAASQSEEASSLRGEIERLQSERHKVRERIRELIREFDKVSW